MYQNTFEALAIKTSLSAREKIKNSRWQEIGSFFFWNYLEQLGKTENAVIGHIKGLIELEANQFIKLSCVRADRPVNVEMDNQPGDSQTGELTFNAIVAKISQEDNLQCFHLALERTCSVYELITDYREAVQQEGEKLPATICPVCEEHHHHSENCKHHH